MHSVTLDSSGSPKKRSFSRGMSEDESLRSIIKESDSSSRRLTRSDSRAGTLKKRSDSQSDQDLLMGLPEMLELQASYDEVVQELRGLEVEREALLFQVDVLQDTLEGVEELLAEAQREAGQSSLELEREKEAKKKLESRVCSLMQEVERLKEERDTKSSVPMNTHESVDGEMRQGQPMTNDAKGMIQAVTREEKDYTRSEPHSSESTSRAVPSSEEVGQDEGAQDEGSVVAKLRRIVSKPLGSTPSLALDNPGSEDGVIRRPYRDGGDDGRDPSPDRNDSDSTSAYEDASAETPERDQTFPGDADSLELPDDSAAKEGSLTNSYEGELQDPKNPELCVVS